MPSEPRWHGALDMARDLTREELGAILAAGGNAPPKIKVATREDLRWLVDQFAAAAERARRAGVDAVELHAGHGYILSEFLSPAWNLRDDEYGGPIEKRARLLQEVIRACKQRAGADFPVWCRIDAVELRTPNGIREEDAQRAAELAEEAGADAIHVSAYADATSGPAFTEAPLVHREAGYVALRRGHQAARARAGDRGRADRVRAGGSADRRGPRRRDRDGAQAPRRPRARRASSQRADPTTCAPASTATPAWRRPSSTAACAAP